MKLVERKNLNEPWWTDLERSHPTLSIFSSLTYLDAVSRNLCFLVNADNTGGMALPYFEKFGIKTLYTPVFFYYATWLGEGRPAADELLQFLQETFQECDFYCEEDYLGEHKEVFTLQRMLGPIVLSSQTKRNLKKVPNHAIVQTNKKTEDVFPIIEESLKGRIDSLSDDCFPVLRELMESLNLENKIRSYAFVLNDKIEGALVCILDKNTWFYLKGGSSEEGKKAGAMSHLMHKAIADCHSANALFDFGGSRVSGVRKFNLGFGATDCHYYRYAWKNGPFWYHWLRKGRDWMRGLSN